MFLADWITQIDNTLEEKITTSKKNKDQNKPGCEHRQTAKETIRCGKYRRKVDAVQGWAGLLQGEISNVK